MERVDPYWTSIDRKLVRIRLAPPPPSIYELPRSYVRLTELPEFTVSNSGVIEVFRDVHAPPLLTTIAVRSLQFPDLVNVAPVALTTPPLFTINWQLGDEVVWFKVIIEPDSKFAVPAMVNADALTTPVRTFAETFNVVPLAIVKFPLNQ